MKHFMTIFPDNPETEIRADVERVLNGSLDVGAGQLVKDLTKAIQTPHQSHPEVPPEKHGHKPAASKATKATGDHARFHAECEKIRSSEKFKHAKDLLSKIDLATPEALDQTLAGTTPSRPVPPLQPEMVDSFRVVLHELQQVVDGSRKEMIELDLPPDLKTVYQQAEHISTLSLQSSNNSGASSPSVTSHVSNPTPEPTALPLTPEPTALPPTPEPTALPPTPEPTVGPVVTPPPSAPEPTEPVVTPPPSAPEPTEPAVITPPPPPPPPVSEEILNTRRTKQTSAQDVVKEDAGPLQTQARTGSTERRGNPDLLEDIRGFRDKKQLKHVEPEDTNDPQKDALKIKVDNPLLDKVGFQPPENFDDPDLDWAEDAEPDKSAYARERRKQEYGFDDDEKKKQVDSSEAPQVAAQYQEDLAAHMNKRRLGMRQDESIDSDEGSDAENDSDDWE